MNGNIAIGSRRTCPTLPAAAAVFSLDNVAPRNTPCCQSKASLTSGIVLARRPPNRIAEIGTPAGSSHSAASIGHCAIGVQYREFGCAPRLPAAPSAGVQSCSVHEVTCAGTGSIPSHQTSPSSVSATLVKIELPYSSVRMALGLVPQLVFGATPKNPFSGFTAYSRPSAPKRIQAMSSPRVSAFQPGMVGASIAMFVLPQPDGNAAAM